MNIKGVSIIIRTLNEKEELANVFKALSQQNFTGESEVIVVDNDSSDGTKELAKKHGAQVITIRKEEFTYPKSMNMGVKEAKYPIVILIVGHAIPIGKNWINAAAKYFEDLKVAGVYSNVIPEKPFSFSEFFLYYPRFFVNKLFSPYAVKRAGRGVFAATNLALRKELWDKHHFEEKYELGGEDTHWAQWAIDQGYKIICDTDFAVRHSHHLNFWGVIQQAKYWGKLKKPTKFSKKELDFRKDLKF